MNDKEEMIIVKDNPGFNSYKPTSGHIGTVGQGESGNSKTYCIC